MSRYIYLCITIGKHLHVILRNFCWQLAYRLKIKKFKYKITNFSKEHFKFLMNFQNFSIFCISTKSKIIQYLFNFKSYFSKKSILNRFIWSVRVRSQTLAREYYRYYTSWVPDYFSYYTKSWTYFSIGFFFF